MLCYSSISGLQRVGHTLVPTSPTSPFIPLPWMSRRTPWMSQTRIRFRDLVLALVQLQTMSQLGLSRLFRPSIFRPPSTLCMISSLTSLCSPRSSSPNFTTSSTLCRLAMVPASPFSSFTTCQSTSTTGLLFQDLLWFPPSLRAGKNNSGSFSSVGPYNMPVFDNVPAFFSNKEGWFNGVAAPLLSILVNISTKANTM